MIYADYASTTPVCKEALLEMEKYFSVDFANASSVHTLGRQSAVAVENARKRIADVLGVKKNEIFFTPVRESRLELNTVFIIIFLFFVCFTLGNRSRSLLRS